MPDWREVLKKPHPSQDGPPAPDGDIEALVEFWSYTPEEVRPDHAVQVRLLEWCETHPGDLGSLLHWFPTGEPQFHDRLKAIADHRWVPKVAALVGGRDATAHNNAVHCLAGFEIPHLREDAIRALLPWLANPKWAVDDESGFTRSRVVDSLSRLDLPESVPGLIWIIEHEDKPNYAAAAKALEHYRARDANPENLPSDRSGRRKSGIGLSSGQRADRSKSSRCSSTSHADRPTNKSSSPTRKKPCCAIATPPGTCASEPSQRENWPT